MIGTILLREWRRLKQAKYYYLWCLRSMVGKIAAMTGAHSACLDTTYNLVLPRTATPAHRQSNICKVGESGKPAAHLASFLREPHAYWCMLQGQRRTAWHAEAGASDEAAMSRQKSNLPWIHDAAPCFSNRALVVCRRGRSTWPAMEIKQWTSRCTDIAVRRKIVKAGAWRAKCTRTCPAFPPSLSARPAPPPPI